MLGTTIGAMNFTEIVSLELSSSNCSTVSYTDQEVVVVPRAGNFLTSSQETSASLNILLGVAGTLANGFVIFLLRSVSSHAKSVFIVNQLTCDFLSSVFIVLTFGWKLARLHLPGDFHKAMCLLLGSEACMWVCLNGSVSNLSFIAAERFVMVKFALWHRKSLRLWFRISVACVTFLWVDSALRNIPTTWVSTDFSNFHCGPFEKWPTPESAMGFIVYYTMVVYVIPIAVFVFFYTNILFIVRRSGKVEPVAVETEEHKDNKNQMAILKTMIIITVTFTILWLPLSIYFVMLNIGCCDGLGTNTTEWAVLIFLGFCTCVINPFIYGFRMGNVKAFFTKIKK